MSAPVLIVVSDTNHAHPSGWVVKMLEQTTRAIRPDIRVHAAFLDSSDPQIDAIVARLIACGYDEFVLVPLSLSTVHQPNADILSLADSVCVDHPKVALRVAEPVGPDPRLLTVLDLRMRDALRVARVRELDGLVLAAAGSSNALATVALARLARTWAAHHRLPVKVAFASTAPPTTAEAIREFRREGRRNIAVGSFFVASGVLLDRTVELALEAGAVAVSEPLGAHAELARLLLARYSVAAFDLIGLPA